MTEWRPAVGKQDYTGRYEVSDEGNVRHTSRKRNLKLWVEQSGHVTTSISLNGVQKRERVHRLVANAFIPNPNNEPFVRHLNDIPGDNRVENLAWGDASSNGLDAVRNGVHPLAKKTHCPRGHLYDMTRPDGSRWCKSCDRHVAKVKRAKGLPDGDRRHGTVNGYSNFSCRCGRCKSVYSEYSRERVMKRAALARRQP